MAEEKHQNKAEETEKLLTFAAKNDLFHTDVEEDKYISEGAEQKNKLPPPPLAITRWEKS